MRNKMLKKLAITLINNKIFQIVGVVFVAAFSLGFLSGRDYGIQLDHKE